MRKRSKQKRDGYVTKSYLNKVLDKKFKEAFDIQLGNFAIMVGKGFADVQRQINEIREDMRENMVTKSEFNFFKDQTERSFHALQTDMTDVKARVTRLETVVEPIPDMLEEMRQHRALFQDHERRIAWLEQSAA